MAGYSRLMGPGEAGTLATLRTCRRELIDPKIAEHRGRIVKTTGDGLLVEFASVVDALRCAAELPADAPSTFLGFVLLPGGRRLPRRMCGGSAIGCAAYATAITPGRLISTR